jgi:hypothetical protein
LTLADTPHGTPTSLGRRRLARVPVMALALAVLAVAVAGGLVRLGWTLPVTAPAVAFHGPLMVGGFLGTLIGLERAVAVGQAWAYAGPIASGLGALLIAAGVPGAAWLILLGSAVMVGVFVEIVTAEMTLFTIVMALGGVCWMAAQGLWLAGAAVHRLAFWWASFLVLTIVGERLELTRILPLGARTRAAVVAAIATLIVGLALSWRAPDVAARVSGVAFVALATWLGAFDVARRTVRQSALPRFSAVALLAGYAWLGIAGLLALRWGGVAAGPQYDAMLHALFVGFVFSTIFAHAPLIFSAVLGARVTYRPTFYVHLGLLHVSLVVRVLADLAPWQPGRRWGGLLNALALLAFLVNTGYGVLAPREPAPGPDGSAAR